MQKLYLFLVLCFTSINFSQGWFVMGDTYTYESKMVFFSVENEGDTTCQHEWVFQRYTPNLGYSCGVLHDCRGCPLNWDVEERICRKCLRKEVWKENRILIEVPKTEFEILDEKIKK